MNGLQKMVDDKIVYVVPEGPSWEYNIQHGFKMRIRFTMDRTQVSQMGRATIMHPRSFYDHTKARKKLYEQYREVAAKLLGQRKVGWNARTYKTNDNDVLIYCHDYDWLAVARLQGHEFIVQTLTAIEYVKEENG
jgi:hypothetical protein